MKSDKLTISQTEKIFKAILYVLDKENIEYEQKYSELREQIIRYTETEVIELLDVIEPFYQAIKGNTNYDELDKEDDITCSICGESFEESLVNSVDYDDDVCVKCEVNYIKAKEKKEREIV